MQPMRLTGFCCVGFMCILLVGCIRAIQDGDVPGNYKAVADWGSSALALSKDHTFRQTVRPNSGEIKRIEGRWTLVGASGNSRNASITLAPYLSVTHDKQGEYAPWSFFSIDHTGFRGMEIAADPGWGIAHRK